MTDAGPGTNAHYVVVGDGPLAFRLTRALSTRFGGTVTVVVPDRSSRYALELDAPAKGLPKPVNPAVQEYFGPARPGEPGVLDADGVLDSVLTALTTEIGLMLDEGVVPGPQQIDLAMILGAGWGFHTGGITPYLDRTGYSEKVLGRRFLPDGVANVPA